MSITRKYIEDEYIEKLINYKYRGGDNSILCYYVIDPLSEFIVKYFPKTLAPNVITVSGWFLNLFNLIVTTYYTGWKGGNSLPPWTYYACSIAFTTYIILDYSDGKQARRLKASSPLGLLIDHGTDACTTFYVTILSGTFSYYDNIYLYLLYYLPVTLTFFMNTLEEYYVGELILPVINGVAEGTFVLDILMALSRIYGISLYKKEIRLFGNFSLPFNVISGISIGMGGCIFSIKSFFGIITKIRKEKIFNAFKDMAIYILFVATIFSVISLNDSIIVKEYPKIIILTFGFQFAKMVGILQLAHILGSPFKVWTPEFLIPMTALLIHSICFYFTGYSILVSIDSLIISVFLWNFISWAHYVYFCSEEICEILNIKRFSLGKRYPDRPSFEEIKKLKYA